MPHDTYSERQAMSEVKPGEIIPWDLLSPAQKIMALVFGVIWKRKPRRHG